MKQKYRVPFLLVLQMIFLLKLSVGQAPASFNPPTPIAREFEKYINYPVDHSTGAAGIDIPLYTLKAGQLTIPVSLSYHTAGVKPGDPSLPVGLGWTINPGARVTRKVMNYPDEMYPKPPYQSNLNGVSDLLLMENMEYQHPTLNPASNANTTYDPEYDVFTYYTGTGVSGKFIIQKQGSDQVAIPLELTKDKIKIHTSNSGGQDFIDYVEVTDANGVLYRFGQGLTTYSTAGSGNPTTENTSGGFNSTGWMLTDIFSADQSDMVSFKWKNVRNEGGNYFKQTGILDRVEITDQMVNGPGTPDAEFQQTTGWHLNPTYPEGQSTESYYLMNVIEGIKYNNIEVKFIYSEPGGTATQLSQMEVYSSATKIRQVNFQKSLFSTGYLRLDGISILDKDVQVVNQYSFGYNLTTALPAGPSREVDFWGYYNAATTNTTLVPNFPYTVETGSVGTGSQVYTQPFSSSSRESNSNASAYILNTITYPTGGKTIYEYDVNSIYDILLHQSVTTGGLRVKKVTHYSVDGVEAESHSFFYGLNECGYGDGPIMRADMFTNTSRVCFYGGGLGLQPFFRKRVLMGSPVNDLFLYDFPPVTYQQVTEYIGDKNGNNSGRIIYKFSPGEIPVRTFALTQSPYTYVDRYWNRPRPLSTEYDKNNDGVFSMVKTTSTSYFTYEPEIISAWLVRRNANFFSPTGTSLPSIEANWFNYYPLGGVFDIAQTFLYRGITTPVTETNIDRSASGEIITTSKTYNYANNDYLYPESITTTNSNGSVTTTHFKYPKDYEVGSSPTNPVAQGIKLLKDKNVVAPTIEEYTEVQPGNVIKSGSFTIYKTDKPFPESIFSLNRIASAGSFSPATITSSAHAKSSSYVLKSTFNLYDQFGNIRQVTDAKEISIVILYSYGGQLPIAIIKNATYSGVTAVISDASITSFASGYPTNTEVNNFLASLRTSLPQAFITTYTHDPAFGMTTQTDENGRTTYYEYDAAGRLQLIKDKDLNVIKTFEYKYKQ